MNRGSVQYAVAWGSSCEGWVPFLAAPGHPTALGGHVHKCTFCKFFCASLFWEGEKPSTSRANGFLPMTVFNLRQSTHALVGELCGTQTWGMSSRRARLSGSWLHLQHQWDVQSTIGGKTEWKKHRLHFSSFSREPGMVLHASHTFTKNSHNNPQGGCYYPSYLHFTDEETKRWSIWQMTKLYIAQTYIIPHPV